MFNIREKNCFILIMMIMCFLMIFSKGDVFQINSQKYKGQHKVDKSNYLAFLSNVFFTSPQFYKIQPFTNENLNKTKNLCQKQVFLKSFLRNQTYAYFNVQYDIKKYFQPIYDFALIENYKALLDVIQWKGFFVILFEFGQFSYFKIIQEDGKTKIKQMYAGIVNAQSEFISEGNFVIANNQLIYFSERQAIRFFENGTFTILANYTPIGKEFEVAKQYDGDCVIIAASERGISHYFVGEDGLQPLGESKIIAVVKQGDKQQKLELQISDVEFDKKNEIMYFLDPQEGLFKTKFNMANPNQTQIFVQNTKLDIDLCQNLKLSGNDLYMTCPNLVIYDVNTGNYKRNPSRLQFIPNQIVKNESSGRLILFGDYNFGYFDELEGQFSFGQTTYLNKALLYKDQLMIFNDFSVFVGKIIPQINMIRCFGDPEMVGLNKGILSIQGSCSTFNPDSLLAYSGNSDSNNLNKSQPIEPQQVIPKYGMCELKVPIQITIQDKQNFALMIFQIILVVGVIWITISMSIYLCVRHIQIRGDYRILEQQATQVRSEIHDNKSQQMAEKPSQNE